MAVAVLDIVKLEDKLKDIVDIKDKDNFLFDFLDLYEIDYETKQKSYFFDRTAALLCI